ncbi:MAG TPA: NAD(P)/FAD-dependent oxidoreductase [Candidatus Limnocylindrales bacterium]|nr:NAD(P)/FAD-dependent oxidoreductase [Candidatus Limnocylindrales bacterium]
MERFDLVVIGAGVAGEAATHYARSKGASVAVVDRALFGGSCPFWACMPSKALLHAAAAHHAGGDYPWSKASDFRDYMINRTKTDEPDDSGHVKSLEEAGATVIRGSATLAGPGRVRVDGRELEAGAVILAVGSVSRVPDLPGLAEAHPWTNVQATSTRELPRSLAILGAGPTGVELAQVYARYDVPVTMIHPRDRVNDRDHRRSSEFLGASLERDGVTLRLSSRAARVRAGEGTDGAHVIELEGGDPVEGHEILLAIGRDLPLDGLGLETIGVTPKDGKVSPDDRLRIAENVYAVGDVGGPELHTHLGHYTGEAAARIALGDDGYRPVLDAIPRATYTDPETASVGLLLEQAQERGIDAEEFTTDIGTSAKGYTAEVDGHCTIVVDRAARQLVGAFMAGPAVSEAIHECVLAIRAQIPLATLADTIHAFPTVARVLSTAFIDADRKLGA